MLVERQFASEGTWPCRTIAYLITERSSMSLNALQINGLIITGYYKEKSTLQPAARRPEEPSHPCLSMAIVL